MSLMDRLRRRSRALNQANERSRALEGYEAQCERAGRVGGWAPGSYENQCATCKTHFQGDKRAVQCLACATGHLTGLVAELRNTVADLRRDVHRAQREVQQCHDKATCMCGDYVKDHTVEHGHTPVSMYELDLDESAEQIRRLEALLCLADELMMQEHGCFPLDRINEDQVRLADGMSAIRAVTGESPEGRKERAGLALQEWRDKHGTD